MYVVLRLYLAPGGAKAIDKERRNANRRAKTKQRV